MIRVDPRNPRGILWIASYPRSGNTWMRVFLYCMRKIMTGERFRVPRLDDVRSYERSDIDLSLYERLAGRSLDPMSPSIARLRPEVQMEIARTNSGVVTVKTHNAFLSERGFPLINPRASVGAIYLVRNPLDVAISYAELRGHTIDITIENMAMSGFANRGEGIAHWVAGSWSENIKSWTEPAHSIVLVLRYEDMVTIPAETFASVARHLHLKPTAAQVAAAINMASFNSLQAAEREQGFTERPAHAETFFREGRIGQWRERLTQDQVSRIVSAHKEMMSKFSYLPD
jgi:Sulfotransferase domain